MPYIKNYLIQALKSENEKISGKMWNKYYGIACDTHGWQRWGRTPAYSIAVFGKSQAR